MNLNFSPVEATRLATATSEICWVILQNEGHSSVDVCFDKINEKYEEAKCMNDLEYL